MASVGIPGASGIEAMGTSPGAPEPSRARVNKYLEHSRSRVIAMVIAEAASAIADDAAAVLHDARTGRLAEAEPLAALGGARRSNSRRDFNSFVTRLGYLGT
jgi:hypothetical protein